MKVTRKQPRGMCNVCGYVVSGFFGSGSGSPCPSQFSGKPCVGIICRTTNAGDWTACERCRATGCGYCGGIGWLFTRPGGFRGEKGPPIAGHSSRAW